MKYVVLTEPTPAGLASFAAQGREQQATIDAMLAATVLAAAPSTCAAGQKSVAELQKDFLDLKFGMFLRYNMATYTNEQWVVDYPDPSTFDPGGPIDTDQWADAAKAAGMKYAVLTAKHVAGVCLWDSKYTTYDVMNPKCPVQEDIVAKFIKSFTSRGLKVGLYYHWRHPGFGDPNKHKVLAPECDPATHSLKEQKESLAASGFGISSTSLQETNS